MWNPFRQRPAQQPVNRTDNAVQNSSLTDVDDPDKVSFKGTTQPNEVETARELGDEAYVKVDNPDDFE